MRRKKHLGFYVIAIFIIGTIVLPGCSQNHNDHRSNHKRKTHGYEHSFKNYSYITRFESPQRKKWQKPDLVVRKMNIKPGDRIADIGAGSGYFTRRFARIVGPKGLALGLDTEINMVRYMKRDIKKLKMKQYQVKKVGYNGHELKSNTFNIVFMCNVYHHISGRIQYFKRVSKSLKSTGRLVIVDFYKRKSPMGPPIHHRIRAEKVIKELKEAGFILIKQENFLPYQYYLKFRKKNNP